MEVWGLQFRVEITKALLFFPGLRTRPKMLVLRELGTALHPWQELLSLGYI